MTESKIIRLASLKELNKKNIFSQINLPYLSKDLRIRDLNSLVDRALALFVLTAYSFGLSKMRAISWIEGEGVSESLTESERKFLYVSGEGMSFYNQKVECLNAFAWSFGFIKELPIDRVCESSLINHFPDINASESSQNFREKVFLRSSNEILSRLDIYYCLHWIYVESNLNSKLIKPKLNDYVIVERRRVLEWISSELEWDQIHLDT